MMVVAGLGILLIVVLAAIKITPVAVYENKELGFSIKYPEYWRVVEKPQNVDVVVFVSPQESEADAYWENVNVTVVPLDPKISSLGKFTTVTIRQLTGVFEGQIQVLQSYPFSVGGRPGHVLVFCGRNTAEPIQYMHAWTVWGTRAYIITYTALKKDFDNYAADAMDMIKSFKLL